MLNILRKQAQSPAIQLLVLIIALVFVFWGVGANLGTKRNALATVNGYEIPFEDYQRLYDTAVDNLRVQFGGNIPQGLLDSLGMKDQILSQLIQAEILRQGGREMGLTVSRSETQDEIKNMDVFQQNGQFDLNRYEQILSQNRMTPVSFETSLQNDLMTKRVTQAIQGFALLPESEIQSRFDFGNEQIKLAYAAFKSSDFLEMVAVEEEQLAAWFEQEKNNYLGQPQIRLKYLFFDFGDDLNQIEPADEELRARYDLNIQQYTTPEQRHARHILFKINETDAAEIRSDKKKQAEEVLKMAQAGEDFAELAKKYSEGPTASSGGDLGFFNKGSMVEKFDEVVFQMQPGDINGVVETIFGFHVIKLEAVRPEVTKLFDDVKDSIAAEMKQENVKEITLERARDAYEGIIRSGSLDKYKESYNEDVLDTDYFAMDSPPGEPVSDPKLLQVAFSLKKGELSSLVEAGNGYAILFVDDIKSPEVPELETVREQVTSDYTNARSVELAKEAAESALSGSVESKVLSADNLAGVELKESDFITRSNPTAAGDVPVQVVQQGFELSLNEPLPKEPLSQGDTFYVFQLLEKRQSEEVLDETQRQVLTEQLTQSVQSRLLADWLVWRQEGAEIWTNEQILN